MKTGTQKKRLNKIMAGAALLGIIILLVAGCSKQTKYKVLTFFFTGVSSTEEEWATEEKRGTPNIGTPVKKREPDPVEFYVHGPYAAKQCFLCHNSSESTENSGFGIGKGSKRITLGFTVPLKDLCTECHTRKSSDSTLAENLWMHGPVASGECIICHDSHKSKYRFMLRVGSNETCTQCHPEGHINKAEYEGREPENLEDCISCHNPHFGKDRMLLRRDYNEVY